MGARLQGNYTNEEMAPVRKALDNSGITSGGRAASQAPVFNGPTAGTVAAEQQQNFDPTVRDRYRSMGEAAANRQAYQVDFGAAQEDRAMGYADREGQRNALGMQREAALGNAPSRAEIMGAQAGGQSLEAAMGASAGARPGGLAAASMASQRGMGGMQLGAQQQMMGMRSGEMNQARGAYAAGAGAMRAGDYQAMGLSQQQAEAQAQAEIAQRHLNQSAQMGYEQMGINREQQQTDEQLRRMQIEAAKRGSDAANAQGALDRNRANAIGATQATGALITLGATGSDERMKQDARVMLSDDRTKLAAAWDEGHKTALENVEKVAKLTPAQMKALDKPEAGVVRSLKADAYDEGVQGGRVKDMKTRQAPQLAEMKAAHEAFLKRAYREPTSFQRGDVPMPEGTMVRPVGAQVSQMGDRQGPAFAGTGPMQAPTPQAAPPPAKPGLIARASGAVDQFADGLADNLGRAYELSDERTKGGKHAEGEMGRALESGLKPFEYEYKPEFAGHERQADGEKNVGPMAQNMASNPVTGTAVKQGGDGLLYIDQPKALKLTMGGVGYLAAKQREMEAELARMKGGR